MKSFETWTLEDLQTEFGLQSIEQSETLDNWLASTKSIDENEKNNIEKLKLRIKKYVNTWNEDELKMNFIAPLLLLVDFTTDRYKSFSQRGLSAKINNIEVSGKVDYMVATGLQKPKRPFFFLHEYKPARRVINDPDGQLLIEMLATQTLNQNEKPLYGVVVEGKDWFFVILEGNKYIISPSYDSTKDEIYQIYAILCKVKDYIEEILAETK